MEEIKIDLINGYEHLRAFYYQNGNGSIFTCKDTKTPIFKAIISVLVLAILYGITRLFPNVGMIFLTIVASIVSVICIMNVIKPGRQYLQWKHSVESLLKRVKKYDVQHLKVTNDYIEISNSDETVVDKWDSAIHATLKPDSIYLKINEETAYIFPKKSMKPDEFISLNTFIRNKIES